MNRDHIIAFAIGAAVGSIITYFIDKKRFDEDMQFISEEIKNDYEDRLKSGIDKEAYEKLNKEYSGEDEAEEIKPEPKPKLTGKKRQPVEIVKTDYNAMSKPKDELDCEIIDLHRYAEDEMDYEKLSLGYFSTDRVFTNIDNNEEIDLTAATHIDMDMLNDLASVQDNVYIRNNTEKMDFEIIVHSCSYAEYMLQEGE